MSPWLLFDVYISYIYTVRKIQITKHLADFEVDEDGDAVFTCEVNYPDEEVQWMLNDKPLFNNEVNSITHVDKTHTLTLKNLAPEDGGKVNFSIRDVKETAVLKVKGKTAEWWRENKQDFRWNSSHF